MFQRLKEWLRHCREVNTALELRWRPLSFLLTCGAHAGGIFAVSVVFTILLLSGSYTVNTLAVLIFFVGSIAFGLAVVFVAAAFLVPICISVGTLIRHAADPTLEAE